MYWKLNNNLFITNVFNVSVSEIISPPKKIVTIECRKNLKQGGFFVKDKNFYCPNDYQTEFGVRCETCHGYVEGEVVTVLGKTFHTHCFRCTTCRFVSYFININT